MEREGPGSPLNPRPCQSCRQPFEPIKFETRCPSCIALWHGWNTKLFEQGLATIGRRGYTGEIPNTTSQLRLSKTLRNRRQKSA